MGYNAKIMIVDDVEMNVMILAEIVRSMNYKPLTALSVNDAIEILEDETPSLILLDASMPGTDGFEFCAMLKQDVYTKDIPVIFISALDSSEDLSRAFEIGAVDFVTKPFDVSNVKMRIETHLKLYNMQMELEETNRRLNSVIKQQMDFNKAFQIDFLSTISEMIYERDDCRTFGRLSEPDMTRILTQALQFTPEYERIITDTFIENIEIAASVHDIGTIRIPDRILLKTDDFSEDERMLINMHTVYGNEKIHKIFKNKGMSELEKVISDVVMYHHENYDGSGFPEGLKGERIPLAGRIVRLVDAYDGLVNDRCYHKGISHEEAVEIIKQKSGEWFDPAIVQVFIKINKKFK